MRAYVICCNGQPIAAVVGSLEAAVEGMNRRREEMLKSMGNYNQPVLWTVVTVDCEWPALGEPVIIPPVVEAEDDKPFAFGKYRGRTPRDVCGFDPSYILWAEGKGLIKISLELTEAAAEEGAREVSLSDADRHSDWGMRD